MVVTTDADGDDHAVEQVADDAQVPGLAKFSQRHVVGRPQGSPNSSALDLKPLRAIQISG